MFIEQGHEMSKAAGHEEKSYRGYAGLPPLVGLETMSDGFRKGMPVAESGARLKRVHWSLKRLHGIFIQRIPSTAIYELKMAFSLHAHLCAEHAGELARRVHEMRQPPYGLDVSPDASLDLIFDEVQAAPDTASLLIGVYEHILPAVLRATERLSAETNKVFDYQTYRLCRFANVELRDAQAYGNTASQCLVRKEKRDELESWCGLLARLLRMAGDLDGTAAASQEKAERCFSKMEPKFDGTPKRDERFIDPFNMGVNAEAMLFDPDVVSLPKTLMLYFKRLREIDVPEVISSILGEASGKPWQYVREMTRQLWDEARHAMMGEIGFASLGIDWTQIPLPITWALVLNTKLSSKERHAVLYAIEQGLMQRKNGKEQEWEIACATENRLTSLIQDYDWADEIVHARIGRHWLVQELGSQSEAIAYGERAWSRVFEDWEKWREEGLTEHRNWWPDLYRVACEKWGIEPDARLLSYHTTYESIRPDMKEVAE
jgi:hypothetical protein